MDIVDLLELLGPLVPDSYFVKAYEYMFDPKVDPSTPAGSDILERELDYFTDLSAKECSDSVWMRLAILFLKSRFPFLPGYDSSLLNFFKINDSFLPLFEKEDLTMEKIKTTAEGKFPVEKDKMTKLFLEMLSQKKTFPDRQRHLRERFGEVRLNARDNLYRNFIKDYSPPEAESIKIWEEFHSHKFENVILKVSEELSEFFDPNNSKAGTFIFQANKWFEEPRRCYQF